jgi:hypothetical protein
MQLFFGLVLLIGGGMAGVSWLAFCFGSIIIGVILLFVAPNILFLPFGLSVYGFMHIEAGYRNILGGKLRGKSDN